MSQVVVVGLRFFNTGTSLQKMKTASRDLWDFSRRLPAVLFPDSKSGLILQTILPLRSWCYLQTSQEAVDRSSLSPSVCQHSDSAVNLQLNWKEDDPLFLPASFFVQALRSRARRERLMDGGWIEVGTARWNPRRGQRWSDRLEPEEEWGGGRGGGVVQVWVSLWAVTGSDLLSLAFLPTLTYMLIDGSTGQVDLMVDPLC